jgi:hypothetical protein
LKTTIAITYGVYGKIAAAYEFISSRQTVAPILTNATSVTISGTKKVGGIVTVNNGTWKGDAPTSYDYSWYTSNFADKSSSTFLKSTATNSLELTSDIGNKYLFVDVTAYNNGGSSNYVESEAVFIETAPVSTNVTPSVDTQSPVVYSIGDSCSKRNCSVFVVVEDAAPSSGIASITGVLSGIVPASKGKDGKIIPKKVITDTLSASSVSATSYQFRIRRAKGVRYSLKVTAIDGVGFTSTPVSIRVRKY